MRQTTRVLASGCVVLLAILSLLPGDEMVRTGFDGHLEHAVAYAGTALLLGAVHGRLLHVAAGLVVYAAILELLQNFSPGRHAAVADWLSSSVGALIGVAAIYLALKRWPALIARVAR